MNKNRRKTCTSEEWFQKCLEHANIDTYLKSQLALADPKKPHILMVTGCASGDGVSTATTILGISLANKPDCKVLIIDANIQNPSLHTVFGLINSSEVLDSTSLEPKCAGRKVRNLIRKVEGYDYLHALSFQVDDFSPSDVVLSDLFDNVLETSGQTYEYVLIDTPSIHHFSLPAILASKADHILLVVKSGVTNKHAAISTKEKLTDAGGHVFGVIFNDYCHYIPEFMYRYL